MLERTHKCVATIVGSTVMRLTDRRGENVVGVFEARIARSVK